jgi:hypothetical protein
MSLQGVLSLLLSINMSVNHILFSCLDSFQLERDQLSLLARFVAVSEFF